MDRLVRARTCGAPGFDGSRAALASLKDSTSQLIGRFAKASQLATREVYGPGPLTRYGADLIVPHETLAEILVLKGLAVAYVMAPRELEPLYHRQREVLADLVHVLSERAPIALEPPFAADWAEAARRRRAAARGDRPGRLADGRLRRRAARPAGPPAAARRPAAFV